MIPIERFERAKRALREYPIAEMDGATRRNDLREKQRQASSQARFLGKCWVIPGRREQRPSENGSSAKTTCLLWLSAIGYWLVAKRPNGRAEARPYRE
jgi:hypothetical protein